MVERYDGEPLPPARPVAHGRPPTPDGTDRYPVPPAEDEPALTIGERWWAIVAVAIVLGAMVIGILR
jgi:hypothetical protein